MKTLRSLPCFCACLALAPLAPCALAQAPAAQPAAQPAAHSAGGQLSAADLEELFAPIALYPDQLLATVLTAAVYPDELQQAKSAAGNAAAIDASSWEPSVKAIAKAPDALKMLTDYPDWTAAIGEAFILQSKDVTDAIQRLRARAYANGSLESGDQQVVQTQGDTIVIQPTDPEVIYVPQYNPSVVYVDDDDDDVIAAGVIGFGLGFATAACWSGCWCDWDHGGCNHGDIDINNDINIDNDRINNIKNNGDKWKGNRDKMSSNLREGRANKANNYRGAGSGRSNAQVPGRTAGSKPIASNRPAPRPSTTRPPSSRPKATQGAGGAGGGRGTGAAGAGASRPNAQPAQRPASMNRPSTPAARPSIPPASARPPVSRPTPAGSAGGARPGMGAGGSGAGMGASGGRSQTTGARPSGGSRPSAYGSGGGSNRAASRGSSSRGGGGGRGGGGRR